MDFFSRGKLLISGEYLVLKGATALSVPLIKGQTMTVDHTGRPGQIRWESRELGRPWFTAAFSLPFFEPVESSDSKVSDHLVRIFRALSELKPGFPGEESDAFVKTDLQFKREWGFGSSSSLLSNMAYWASVDPFELHRKVSSGSGYDVVSAREEGPVFFRLTRDAYTLDPVKMNEKVCRHVYFVYLGRKEDSQKQVSSFLGRNKSYRMESRMVSELGKHMAHASTIEDFGFYMKEHEQVISSILKKPGMKETIFSDLPGEAKSLGAWGGDFAMITWTGTRKALKNYLADKRLNVHFSYKELVKTP